MLISLAAVCHCRRVQPTPDAMATGSLGAQSDYGELCLSHGPVRPLFSAIVKVKVLTFM
jgi:hypothetical protein